MAWIRNSIRTVADVRDWVLVIAGTLYFFGYLVWAINAKRNNLGLLSAVDFQYFIAGIFPVVTLAIILCLTISVEVFRKRIINALHPKAERPYGTARRIIIGLWSISLGIVLIFAFLEDNPTLSRILPLWLRHIATVAFLICSLVLPEVSTLPAGLSEKIKHLANSPVALFLLLESFLGRLMARLFIVGLPILGFFWLVTAVYPRMPQEFGGMKPTCARLDIERAKLSRETLAELSSPEQLSGVDPIVGTAQIELIFSGPDLVVLRSNGKIHKVTRDAIHAMRTCQ